MKWFLGVRTIFVPRSIVYLVDVELTEPTNMFLILTWKKSFFLCIMSHNVGGKLEVEERICVYVCAFKRYM